MFIKHSICIESLKLLLSWTRDLKFCIKSGHLHGLPSNVTNSITRKFLILNSQCSNCAIERFPANTLALNKRWNNVDCQRLSMLFQRWYLVESESWADAHLSTLPQHWQNNVEATSIKLRWLNVDEPMLFQRWNLVEIESWANVCLLKLFQRWQNNVETTLKELRQFNIDDPMLFQSWYLVENESWINVCSPALLRH